MHRTSTTVKLLVAVAVTALSGCVSVQPRPSAPPASSPRPAAQDLAPQIGRPPVRDALEAVPDPKPSTASAGTGRSPAAPPAARHTGPRALPRAPQPRHDPGPAQPRPPRRTVPAPPAPTLPAPVTGTDVCALGRGYGHWPAGSPQSRICDRTYGH
ncbi:hypothetical protein [Streptomyces sp. ITFR-6]|uniref:hypothetical protein n=1 Tax=Streptomyces sp. ITFR-6 TaxID=3075197 RepID=UPI00288BC2DF|nr:hypothetical protein [Streptomyces sp. ITFR-6]WNI33269.1 hypothetical protein RLT59_34060 [Streptomyces sp. ITFR-6]